jgi:uncharacterized protein (DUF1810 family)
MGMGNATFDPSRFLVAQEPVYTTVLRELRSGRKRTHWMWFVFPQLAGLGHSFMATHYGLADLDQARLYLRHPVLGVRLKECTRIVNALEGRSAYEIFGDPDELKFRSSMSLFMHAAPAGKVFALALAKYFAGEADEVTLGMLRLN